MPSAPLNQGQRVPPTTTNHGFYLILFDEVIGQINEMFWVQRGWISKALKASKSTEDHRLALKVRIKQVT